MLSCVPPLLTLCGRHAGIDWADGTATRSPFSLPKRRVLVLRFSSPLGFGVAGSITVTISSLSAKDHRSSISGEVPSTNIYLRV